jgi:hypothetical protein
VNARNEDDHFFLQIIYVICERLLELAQKGHSLSLIRSCPSIASLDKKFNLDSDVPKENGIPRVTSKISLESQISSSQVEPQGVRKGSVCMEDIPNERLLRLKNKESETSLKSELDTNSIGELLSQKSDDLDIVSSDLGNLSTNDVAEVLGANDVEEEVFNLADQYQVRSITHTVSHLHISNCRGRHGHDRMVVGFTTAYAISAYHH